MALADIVGRVDSDQRTVTVLNRDEYDPVMSLLERLFDSENVDVRESGTAPAGPANIVQLQDEDGLAIATSGLDEIRDRLLMVNSDMYVTGTRSLEDVDTSNVVANLDDTTFTVANKSKFLLIHLSRHIEALALETGDGVLHTGFQRLSRIRDERGTERAYRRLAGTDLDVHVYGLPDVDLSDWPAGVRVHDRDTDDVADGWFVVHDGDGLDRRKAALVCVETGREEYEGFWTFQPDTVDDILDYLTDRYVGP